MPEKFTARLWGWFKLIAASGVSSLNAEFCNKVVMPRNVSWLKSTVHYGNLAVMNSIQTNCCYME